MVKSRQVKPLKKISNDILNLKNILKTEHVSKTTAEPYVFNYIQYVKWQAEQFTKNIQSGIAWGLWMMGPPGPNPKNNHL